MRYSTLRKKLLKLQHSKTFEEFKKLLEYYIETYSNPPNMHPYVLIFWCHVICEIMYRKKLDESLNQHYIMMYYNILNMFNYKSLDSFCTLYMYDIEYGLRYDLRKYKKERYKKEIHNIFNMFPSEIVETILGFL